MTSLNQAIKFLADMNNPQGWEAAPIAPDSYEALLSHMQGGNKMLVWDGACEKTIFGDAATNQAFRAWHDAIHYKFRFDFSENGEFSAMLVQLAQLEYYFPTVYKAGGKEIIRAEIEGQLAYQKLWGYFPTDQKAFILGYLNDKELALSVKW
jgi:hypothetical protein